MNSANKAPVSTDRIRISMSSLYAQYDCDNTGFLQPPNPGDFYYNINVDTLDKDGKWLAVTKFGESKATLHSGDSKTVSDRNITFNLPRTEGYKFRVRLTLRESDGSSNDFSRSKSFVHTFVKSSDKWDPSNNNYTWNASKRSGSQRWDIFTRDQEKNIFGAITEEGCSSTVRYTFSADVSGN
jgi:hypothetical protein